MATVAEGGEPVVAVTGMHRSGTSVITDLVRRLGVPVCATGDLMPPNEFNPAGYWESLKVSAYGDRVLREAFNACWMAPQPPQPWSEALLQGLAEDGLATLSATHPPAPFVWKDPRTSVLLPLWRRALDDHLAVVLVHRHPSAVARSLQNRDDLPIVHGLALWERYCRSALAGLTGLPVFVLAYERLVADPPAELRALRSFLGDLGLPLRRGSLASIAGAVHRDDTPEDDDAELDPSQIELRKLLANLAGSHSCFQPVVLDPEPRWIEGLLETHRRSCQSSGAAAAEAPDNAEELSALRAELERAGGYARDLEGELRRRVAELEVAQSEVRALISDLAMREHHLGELEVALDSAEHRVDQLDEQCVATQSALEVVEARVRAYEARIAVRLADRCRPWLVRLPGLHASIRLAARTSTPPPP